MCVCVFPLTVLSHFDIFCRPRAVGSLHFRFEYFRRSTSGCAPSACAVLTGSRVRCPGRWRCRRALRRWDCRQCRWCRIRCRVASCRPRYLRTKKRGVNAGAITRWCPLTQCDVTRDASFASPGPQSVRVGWENFDKLPDQIYTRSQLFKPVQS